MRPRVWLGIVSACLAVFEQVIEFTGIPARFAEVAGELRDQLVVTYARPQSEKGSGKLDVSVKRRGIKLRAPKQTP